MSILGRRCMSRRPVIRLQSPVPTTPGPERPVRRAPTRQPVAQRIACRPQIRGPVLGATPSAGPPFRALARCRPASGAPPGGRAGRGLRGQFRIDAVCRRCLYSWRDHGTCFSWRNSAHAESLPRGSRQGGIRLPGRVLSTR